MWVVDRVRTVAEEFSVKYDGEALADHRMNVRTLAPALLALGDAFDATARLLGPETVGDKTVPSLQITATREGSFDIDLVLSVLTSSDVETATANLAYVGGTLWAVVKGAIKLRQWLRNSRGVTLERTDSADGRGTITYIDQNGTSITVPAGTDLVIRDPAFRAAVDSFTAPLDQDGIDTLEIDSTRSEVDPETIVIRDEDRPAYRFEQVERLLDSSVRTTTVRVETVQLNQNTSRKWRFSEDGETFTAKVTDDRFLLGVSSGARPVGADDKLTVEIEERTIRRASGGVRIDRTIQRVVDVERAERQSEFDYAFDDETPES
ncbi:hypothetical protein ASG84_12725 [Rhodococcus sp. Leaf278]|nr:hypothetical protein ASG84_12725 [Rhodococcus sp. Leaf278]